GTACSSPPWSAVGGHARTSGRSWIMSTDWASLDRTAPGRASADSVVCIVWIYPDLLSTYGDRGNLLVLAYRAARRGLAVETLEVRSDRPVPVGADIYLLGGGEDGAQALAAQRLAADGGLARAADRGAVVFAVCAGYQLLGRSFVAKGRPCPGLGLLDVE